MVTSQWSDYIYDLDSQFITVYLLTTLIEYLTVLQQAVVPSQNRRQLVQ